MHKHYCILLAGGTGSRCSSDLPKQFIPILGKPIILHTIEKIIDTNLIKKIIVVCNKDYMEHCSSILDEWKQFIEVIEGGANSHESLAHGIERLHSIGVKENELVMIHEAVRPNTSPDLIKRIISTAEKFGNAVSAISPIESIGINSKDHSGELSLVDRQDCYLLQMPQAYKLSQIVHVLESRETYQSISNGMLLKGQKINLCTGDRYNIKVTFEQDLSIIKSVLSGGGE